MLRRRSLTRSASALLALGLCVSCGSAGNGDYIELFPDAGEGGASGAGGSSGASGAGGVGGSEDSDAGLGGDGGVGGSESGLDGGVEPGILCEVAFVTPAAGAGSLHLGIDDDVDGTACGSSFATSVRVASNAASVALWVNDTTNSGLRQDVAQLGALFPNVQLSNAGNTPNVLKAVATMADGRSCEATLDTQVFVDCDMPSCTIVNPSGSQYLNDFQDDSPAGGLQIDFEVGTELENVGQPVRLTLDGAFNQSRSAEVLDQAGNGVAIFVDVSLQEGRRLAQAECRDAAGNVAYSSLAEWIVDTTPCSIDLDLLPNPITTVHDQNLGQPGLQIEVGGSVSGDGDCAEVLVGLCDSESFSTNAFGSGGQFSVLATLPAADAAALEICGKVSDQAGNIGGSAPQTKRVRVTPPVVAILTPVQSTLINHATDLVDTSPSCEVGFSVSCSDVDEDVQLRQGNATLATANCADNGSSGLATFAQVSLVSRDDGSNASITARQTVDGLTGTSAVRLLRPDCHLPDIRFANSARCNGQLSLTGNDSNSGTSGLQYVISVLNDGATNVALDVTLGSDPTFQPTATPGSGPATFFSVDFGEDETTAVLHACGEDQAGNANCSASCSVQIADVPLVTITDPSNNAVLTIDDDDCAPGTPGLQVQVAGTVDAVDGSNVVISVGTTVTSSGTLVASGAFDACVDAFDDGPNKPLTVSVTDSARPSFPGVQSIFVSVDGNDPTAQIAAPSAQVVERRGGIVRLTWPAVSDVGGGPMEAYVLGCSRTEIEDDGDWPSVTRDIPLTPHTSGSETIDLDGFRVGTRQFCAIRGRDIGGSLTPLPANPSTEIEIDFLTQEITTLLDAPGSFLASLTPVGDVNGDGFDDFVYGLVFEGAQLFFGSEDPGDIEPSVAITGADGVGMNVAGVGDVNGDNRPDFAVSSSNGSDGAVYVFFGRALNQPWTDIDLSASASCGADLCLRGIDPGALLGWDLNGGDFDGDGRSDLLIGAPSAALGSGRVYVVKGGTHLVSGSELDLPATAPGNDPPGFIIEAGAGTLNFGISVAMVGGGLDGRGDLVVGANGVVDVADGAVVFVPGQAYAGPNLQVITPQVQAIFATGDAAEFGNPVRGVGDFDGDGTGDVAVGNSNGAGQCQVFTRGAGDAGYSSSHLTFDNDANDSVNWSAYMGNGVHPSLGLIGDLDEDGHGELLVGSFGYSGSADIYYGELGVTGRLRSEADFHFPASTNGDIVPSFVGDVNNDGFNDVAVVEFDPFHDPQFPVTPKMTILY
ncbi:MAG: hypothetical protein ABW217_19195 [Polyangiaceae bacterium]